ncbi:protein EARLY-RESPONSIVE TO DEHYDRATION 7, chloroplastic-like [Olea europaea var. sylvestris]|uniref:protein EARLY-RESPONSIVE TO DEHYDRATION 7, chloroplastic-like n=1 Tax=Olea europaea var. sylvestris TaxID=158386 RepID=UPI000C1CEF19|nr:protein EARLY-RESPONSIVE TO DEHYDRATION 7, chloroplastic-like [Olea europaea var. sylvestris]
MESQNPNPPRTPMYPKVIDSNYQTIHRPNPSSTPLYPTIDPVENLFPHNYETHTASPSAPPESIEEVYLTIPGAILHLIDQHYSVELASGALQIIVLYQGDNTVASFARVGDETQWPLTKDLAAVKLDQSHYFFSFQPPKETEDSDSNDDDGKEKKKKKKKKNKKNKKEKVNMENEVLSYGLTIVSKGQEGALKELDRVLETYCNFSFRRVEEKEMIAEAGAAARGITAGELNTDKKKMEAVEGQCAAYWTTLAPNVEEYSGTAARLIAAGSGHLVKGILWCGDVTVDRLKSGNEMLKERVTPGENSKIDPKTLKRIKRVKRVTKMTEKVAVGVLSGAVKVSGFFTGSVANSKVGKKLFGHLPGEIVLASLDGFSKICDAVEVAGKNVMSTSSTVTTGLVSHRYGNEAGEAASEGLDAAGHAMGTAWAVFKIRKAFNPKSVLKPSTLAASAIKTAAAEKKGKSSK